MRQAAAVLLFLVLVVASLWPRVAVFPFQVSGQDHASLQWLGKAFSFYLLTAYDLNDIPVFAEEDIQRILNQNRVRFPFSMTKATAMALARDQGASVLVWGKITYDAKDPSQICIRISYIDLEASVQKEMPDVRGRWNDLFPLLQQAFRQLIQVQGGSAVSIQMPEPGLSLSDFEKLVKSFLVAEAEKKLELLAPAAANPSDFVIWEVVKIQARKGDWAMVENLLGRMSDQPYFRKGKKFMLALAAFGAGKNDNALERFLQLQRENDFPPETHNNLGVIHLTAGNYAQAVPFFRQALAMHQDPEIWSNYIYLLVLMKREESAFLELTQALPLFPEDQRLQRIFSYFLNRLPDKEKLVSLFLEYVPTLLPEEELQFKPCLKNPFTAGAEPPSAAEAKYLYIEARNHFLENETDRAQEQVEQALELNPFTAELYHLLAMIHLKRREIPLAEASARAALLLKETEENYLLQIKVLLAAGQKERVREMADAACRKFPDSKELRAVKIK